MLNKMTAEQFKELAKQGKPFAIHCEMAADNLTPISAHQALGELAKGATLLESTPETGKQARFSFIGIEPIAELHSNNDKTATETLREFHAAQHCETSHAQAGFLGGIVGFMTYDSVRQFEAIPDQHENKHELPDFSFTSYKTNITFDHLNNKVTISRRIEESDGNEESYKQAMTEIAEIAEKMRQPVSNEKIKLDSNEEMAVDIDDETFCQLVEKTKAYIKAGDIFQAVISREFSKKLNATPFEVYRALRMVSPAPYLFYLDRGDYVITGASPEKLISVEDNIVTTNPLAGTRKQSSDLQERDRLEKELLADKKELAEHVMLVDLGRNDVGKVSKPGSVKVTEFSKVKHYSHVMHIASEVVGELREDQDAFDALAAAFPAGTLSGAPKIRAMEIIDELEKSRRGVYGGVVCFVDNQGNLNSCITIRTAFIKDGVVSVRAGAGIVYDSNPQAEADETRHKASTVLNAIEFAEEKL
jgi:anthranilate synthase component 1